MFLTRVVIYTSGGVIQQIESPDDTSMIRILIEDNDDKAVYPAGVVPINEESWNNYVKRSLGEDDEGSEEYVFGG